MRTRTIYTAQSRFIRHLVVRWMSKRPEKHSLHLGRGGIDVYCR